MLNYHMVWGSSQSDLSEFATLKITVNIALKLQTKMRISKPKSTAFLILFFVFLFARYRERCVSNHKLF